MQTLSFEPLISSTLWTTLAVGLAALGAWYAWGRPPGMARWRWVTSLALMSLAAALVLIVLLNPTWVQQIPSPSGKPWLTVLVDTSASMATLDAGEGRSRLDAAAAAAQEIRAGLGPRFDVRGATFGAAVAPSRFEDLGVCRAEGAMTDLAAAIRAGTAQQQPQGQALVLLSDGIHNAGGGADEVLAAAGAARAGSVPIYVRTIGGQQHITDIELRLRSAQELTARGQHVPITAVVRRRQAQGASATVILQYGHEELARSMVVLMQEETDVHFDVSQDKVGVYRYDLRVDPIAEEATEVNNNASFVLRVSDEPVRVLLLEGKPYWDGKFLMRTLAFDPAIELRSIVRLTPSRLLERVVSVAGSREAQDATNGDDPAPTTSTDGAPPLRAEDWRIITEPLDVLASAEALERTQVIVLGREAEPFLTDEAIARLREWIARDGGSLVCYRGAPTAQVNQRLGALLPVRWTPAREARFHVQLTDRGRDLRWLPQGAALAGDILTQLPTLATGTRVESPKPMTVVLASARSSDDREDFPVVSYQPYGTGRVVVIEGAGMWRWAFLAPEYRRHDDVYRTLWHSLLRWLVSSTGLLPGQDVALRADKVSFSTTEPATATLLLRNEPAAGEAPVVELVAEDQTAASDNAQSVTASPVGDAPGAYRVVFGKLPEGRYLARVRGAEAGDVASHTAFDVRGFLEERLNLRARPDLMARIADDSGGMVIGEQPAESIAGHFAEYQSRTHPPRVLRTTAWDRWWVMGTVLASWACAWVLRRAGGLV